MSASLLKNFRRVAIAEGISFLVLLLVAMPLKYIWGKPQAVLAVGWAHGVLFVAFVALAFAVMINRKKGIVWFGIAFICSLLPLGTFWLDRRLEKEEG